MPDRHAYLRQHPECNIVGGQPLQVAEHAPADAQRANRDHCGRNRNDAGMLGGLGQQESGDGEQSDAAARGRGACCYRGQQPAPQRAGERQQPQQRPLIPAEADGGGPGGHGLAAMASPLTGRDATSAGGPPTLTTWLAPRAPVYRWVATRTVRPAIASRTTRSIAAAAAGARWAVGSSSRSSGASRTNARARASC